MIWSVVWLPDTQFYTKQNPAIFDSQTQWIADNMKSIKIVLHVGDVVHDGGPATEQWENAVAAMAKIAEIPHLISIGNHDYDTDNLIGSRESTTFNSYFGQSYYTEKSWWSGGFFEADKSENAYLKIVIDGQNYLFLSLEFYPRAATLTWANQLVADNYDHDVVISTHAYLYNDGQRASASRNHSFVPPDYGIQADAADGDDLWSNLISNHKNIVWIQNGHFLGGGIGQQTDSNVHQILANYQWPIVKDQDAEGGQLRICQVSRNLGTIDTSTYSPWLDAWKTDASNQFTLKFGGDTYDKYQDLMSDYSQSWTRVPVDKMSLRQMMTNIQAIKSAGGTVADDLPASTGKTWLIDNPKILSDMEDRL